MATVNELATKFLETARQRQMSAQDARAKAGQNWGFVWEQAWLLVATKLEQGA